MFTRSDLSTLTSASPDPGVSIFLPTHVRGREVRQGPVRLKNLTGLARDRLLAQGWEPADAEELLRPVAALVEDRSFWQHQDEGLAVFLDGDGARVHQLPVPVVEQVVVGPGFHVRPLLAVLAGDGAFDVLTVTADDVRLFRASRFTMVEDHGVELPSGLGDVMGEPDYENPVQASPVARPNTGHVDIGNAQVYGDSPADWNERRLQVFARSVAAAVDARPTGRSVPVVLVADSQISGHFRGSSALGALLAGTVETNPAALQDAQLHEAAYSAVRARLDADREAAVDRYRTLLGRGDPRAAAGVEAVVGAAHQGRVDTLLLSGGGPVPGRYDVAADRVVEDDGHERPGVQDLLDLAAVRTLQNGGRVHLLVDDVELGGRVGAVLRY